MTETQKMIVALRLRGDRGLEQGIESTMTMLNLHKKYFCVLIQPTATNKGMLKKVKDFITWGEASDELAKMLVEKRSEKDSKNPKQMKKFFRLHPPVGGFRRRGIKVGYNNGGDLGYRGEKINDLIKRMIA